jgi:ribonuclease HII
MQLREAGISFGVGFARASEIDVLGLTKALAVAAERGLQQLTSTLAVIPDDQWLLLDGNSNYLGGLRAQTIIGGDRAHPLIAAASIAAKVARDDLMKDLDLELPYWDFSSSKGYGSLRHRFGLIWQGPSVEHRHSFRPVRELATPVACRFFLLDR